MERADNSVGRVEKRRLREDGGKTVGPKEGEKGKRNGRQRGARGDKKRTRGKMQRGKTPKKVEELSRRCCLLLISPSPNSPFTPSPSLPLSPPTPPFQLSCYPSARPSAALFMTLSTSLAAIFLRHYTWKNFVPGKLDIESTRSLPEKRASCVCILCGGRTVQ